MASFTTPCKINHLLIVLFCLLALPVCPKVDTVWKNMDTYLRRYIPDPELKKALAKSELVDVVAGNGVIHFTYDLQNDKDHQVHIKLELTPDSDIAGVTGQIVELKKKAENVKKFTKQELIYLVQNLFESKLKAENLQDFQTKQITNGYRYELIYSLPESDVMTYMVVCESDAEGQIKVIKNSYLSLHPFNRDLIKKLTKKDIKENKLTQNFIEDFKKIYKKELDKDTELEIGQYFPYYSVVFECKKQKKQHLVLVQYDYVGHTMYEINREQKKINNKKEEQTSKKELKKEERKQEKSGKEEHKEINEEKSQKKSGNSDQQRKKQISHQQSKSKNTSREDKQSHNLEYKRKEHSEPSSRPKDTESSSSKTHEDRHKKQKTPQQFLKKAEKIEQSVQQIRVIAVDKNKEKPKELASGHEQFSVEGEIIEIEDIGGDSGLTLELIVDKQTGSEIEQIVKNQQGEILQIIQATSKGVQYTIFQKNESKTKVQVEVEIDSSGKQTKHISVQIEEKGHKKTLINQKVVEKEGRPGQDPSKVFEKGSQQGKKDQRRHNKKQPESISVSGQKKKNEERKQDTSENDENQDKNIIKTEKKQEKQEQQTVVQHREKEKDNIETKVQEQKSNKKQQTRSSHLKESQPKSKSGSKDHLKDQTSSKTNQLPSHFEQSRRHEKPKEKQSSSKEEKKNQSKKDDEPNDKGQKGQQDSINKLQQKIDSARQVAHDFSTADEEKVKNCLRFNGPLCVRCYHRFFLDMNGFCQPVPDECISANPYTGECYQCKTGYVPSYGKCIVINPLCMQANPYGQCTKCYKHFILIDGQCFREGKNLRGTGIPLCQRVDSQDHCCECEQGAYLTPTKQCRLIDGHCQKFDHSSLQCKRCKRGFEPFGVDCVRVW